MNELKRKKPIPRTWGSSRIHCDHEMCKKSDIIYCKRCGKNFMEEELSDDQYYTMFDHKAPEFAIDHMVNDIMPQEVEEMEYEESIKKNRSRGRPKKNPFTYSGDYL